MSRMRDWAIKFHLARLFFIVCMMLMTLPLRSALARESVIPELKKPWTGKMADGREISKGDLEKNLKAHNLWVKSIGEEGQQADLHKAKLWGADLSGVNFNKANLNGADLLSANLSNAALVSADLREARLSQTNLSGAFLVFADLTGASLYQTNLQGADLGGCNLSEVVFEPKAGTVPDASKLLMLNGLQSLHFSQSAHGLLGLRETFKKAGLRDEERQITFALNHDRWVFHTKADLLGILEKIFQFFCFELTCQYGMSPGRPLKILAIVILISSLPYMLALRSPNREVGIWLVLMSNRGIGYKAERSARQTDNSPSVPAAA